MTHSVLSRWSADRGWTLNRYNVLFRWSNGGGRMLNDQMTVWAFSAAEARGKVAEQLARASLSFRIFSTRVSL